MVPMPTRAGSRSRKRVGAFFDVDKTLISENSGSLYMKRRYKLGEISGFELLKGLGAYLRYKLGLLDIAGWSRDVMQQFFRGRRSWSPGSSDPG
jgi:hypothetical protein